MLEWIAPAFTWQALLFMLAGLGVGVIFGVIPGLSGVTAIALLTPFTYGMEPINALILMASIYCGAVYSGSISAILFNCPGDVPAVATSTDGYPMRLKGQAGRALSAAMISSGVGGIVGVAVAWIGAAKLVDLVFLFGPAEYMALALLGLALAASIGAKDPIKALASVMLGLLFGCVGSDPVLGTIRFSFGKIYLYSGISFVPALIGIYALAEVFNQFAHMKDREKLEALTNQEQGKYDGNLTKEDYKLALPHWARNSIIGTLIGMLPGAGSTIAALVGYGVAKTTSKNKDEFGKGAIEGVFGPEVSNNAAVGGAFVPLLTMGIPGSSSTALILNVFLIHGLQPGPTLFANQPQLVYPIFISMLIVNIMILFVPRYLTKYIVKVLQIPFKYMGVGILFVAMIGAFAISNRVQDIWLTLVFGVIGFFMVKYEYSPAAMALGLILGPILEKNFRQMLMLYRGDFTRFLHSPIALVLTLIAAFIVVRSIISGIKMRANKKAQTTES